MITAEQHDRWERARRRWRLDPASAEFGTGGLMACLDGPGVAAIVMPSEVRAQHLQFENGVPNQVPTTFEGITANGVGTLPYTASTSTGFARYSPAGDGTTWLGYVAVRRDGGVEAAIGSGSRYRAQFRAGPATIIRLYTVIHMIRQAVETQSALLAEDGEVKEVADQLAPFDLVVALPKTDDTWLGCYNDGWEHPEHLHDPPRPIESNVLVRHQVEQWPTERADRNGLLFKMADRVSAALGDRERRWVARTGANAGTLHLNYA